MKCEQIPLPELIRGELPESAASSVQDHLETCPVCRERARIMAVLETAEAAPPQQGHRVFRVAVLAAAALVMGCLLVLLYDGRTGPAPSRQAAALATERAYPFVGLSVRGRRDRADRQRFEAFSAYQRGDYSTAVRGLEGSANDAESTFYLGVSLYLLGEPETALTHLRVAASTPQWREAALWYQANALLKLDRIASARRCLEEVIQAKGEFEDPAGRLLLQLDAP